MNLNKFPAETGKMIYLASPFWHEDSAVRHNRYLAATQAAGTFILDGILIFSPITHCYPIDQEHPDNFSNSKWTTISMAYLKRCQSLLVLELPGWNRSTGVAGELAYARRNRLSVIQARPDFLCKKETLEFLQTQEIKDQEALDA